MRKRKAQGIRSQGDFVTVAMGDTVEIWPKSAWQRHQEAVIAMPPDLAAVWALRPEVWDQLDRDDKLGKGAS